MHLLSWHGTVMCRSNARGAITHQPLPLADDAPPAMVFDAPALTGRTQTRHPELGLLRIEAASGRGGVHLFREGTYICADANTPPLQYDRLEAGGWETWLPLSPEDLADLQHILRHRWIVRETRRVIRRTSVTLADAFVLQLGAFEIDLVDGLSSRISGRGPAGLPERLVGADFGAPVELVIAEPRSSALIDTAIWPVRARRTAEIVTLAAHRHITGEEPSQEVFERDTASVLGKRGAAGLSDLLEELSAAQAQTENAPPAPPALAAEAERDDVLMAWALREMLPWLLKPVHPSRTDYVFEELNTTEPWAFVYAFADGEVTMAPKPETAGSQNPDLSRANCYLGLFRKAARLLPPEYRATLCVGVADSLTGDFGVPMFCFQKRAADRSILLPDIDFLLSDFHLAPDYTDRLAYEMKAPTAVFAGSTTGGTVTPEVAQSCLLPRLRAARFFTGSRMVDFRLPNIAQCSSEEAEDILRAYRFCQVPALTWQQQLRHRFIISMDGNGATCSRVAIALRSNSVLLKYDSEHLLFYVGGLQPWLHYIPVANDRNIERIMALEPLMPDAFRQIAQNGRAFATTYLCEDAIVRYTAMLLTLYARAILGEAGPIVSDAASRLPTSAAAARDTVLEGHIQNRGDVSFGIDEWLGEPGSTLAVEGFTISPGEGMPAEGLFYQAVLQDGSLSERVRQGEFCGTQGENMPIYGLCISTEGAFADAFDLAYEASFIDGTEIGPVAAGTVCKAATGIALEAFRLSITDRTPPRLEPTSLSGQVPDL